MITSVSEIIVNHFEDWLEAIDDSRFSERCEFEYYDILKCEIRLALGEYYALYRDGLTDESVFFYWRLALESMNPDGWIPPYKTSFKAFSSSEIEAYKIERRDGLKCKARCEVLRSIFLVYEKATGGQT